MMGSSFHTLRRHVYTGTLLLGVLCVTIGQVPPVQTAWTTASLHQVQPMGWFQSDMKRLSAGSPGGYDSLMHWPLHDLFPADEVGHASRWTWQRARMGHAVMEHLPSEWAAMRSWIDTVATIWKSASNPPPIDPALIHCWLDGYQLTRDTTLLLRVHEATMALLSKWKEPTVYPASGDPELLDLLFDLVRLTGLPFYRESMVHLAGIPLAGTPVQQLYPQLMAWSVTGQNRYWQEVERLMEAIAEGLQPSGAWASPQGIPDVQARGSSYSPDDQLLLLKTYNRLLMLTGEGTWADKAEHLALNALSGFVHPDREGWACTREDNAMVALDGSMRVHFSSGRSADDVSCLSTLLSVHPEIARHAWMVDSHELVLPWIIPGEFNTRLHDRPVRITTVTEFAGDHRIHYIVQTDSLHSFRIRIRKPAWVKAITVDHPYRLESGYIVLDGPWTGFDEVHLTLVPSVSTFRTANGERYFTYGPLVLAHPFPSVDIPVDAEQDTGWLTSSDIHPSYDLTPSAKAKRIFSPDAADMRFTVEARNRETGLIESIPLAPLSWTILRQTTFPIQP